MTLIPRFTFMINIDTSLYICYKLVIVRVLYIFKFTSVTSGILPISLLSQWRLETIQHLENRILYSGGQFYYPYGMRSHWWAWLPLAMMVLIQTVKQITGMVVSTSPDCKAVCPGLVGWTRHALDDTFEPRNMVMPLYTILKDELIIYKDKPSERPIKILFTSGQLLADEEHFTVDLKEFEIVKIISTWTKSNI